MFLSLLACALAILFNVTSLQSTYTFMFKPNRDKIEQVYVITNSQVLSWKTFLFITKRLQVFSSLKLTSLNVACKTYLFCKDMWPKQQQTPHAKSNLYNPLRQEFAAARATCLRKKIGLTSNMQRSEFQTKKDRQSSSYE